MKHLFSINFLSHEFSVWIARYWTFRYGHNSKHREHYLKLGRIRFERTPRGWSPDVLVCAHCYEEIQGISAGDEGWDYCEGCQQIEGDTLYISELEYEAKHG